MTQDRQGRPLAPGDTVRAVHFGEEHEFEVLAIETVHGQPHLAGRVTIRVPAQGSLLVRPGERVVRSKERKETK